PLMLFGTVMSVDLKKNMRANPAPELKSTSPAGSDPVAPPAPIASNPRPAALLLIVRPPLQLLLSLARNTAPVSSAIVNLPGPVMGPLMTMPEVANCQIVPPPAPSVMP